MDHKLASKLATTLRSTDATLNAAAALIEEISDEGERKKYRRALALVVGAIYTDLIAPIGKDHPDVLPPEVNV